MVLIWIQNLNYFFPAHNKNLSFIIYCKNIVILTKEQEKKKKGIEGLTISVDTWTLPSKRKRHYFLTHLLPIKITLTGFRNFLPLLFPYTQVCLCFPLFFHFFRDAHLFLFLFLGFVELDYYYYYYFWWELRLWMILMGLSLSRLLMPVTTLVINHGYVLYFVS